MSKSKILSLLESRSPKLFLTLFSDLFFHNAQNDFLLVKFIFVLSSISKLLVAIDKNYFNCRILSNLSKLFFVAFSCFIAERLLRAGFRDIFASDFVVLAARFESFLLDEVEQNIVSVASRSIICQSRRPRQLFCFLITLFLHN